MRSELLHIHQADTVVNFFKAIRDTFHTVAVTVPHYTMVELTGEGKACIPVGHTNT